MPMFESETTIQKLGMHAGDLRARVSLQAGTIELQYNVPHEVLVQLIQDATKLGRVMSHTEALTRLLNDEVIDEPNEFYTDRI